MLARVVSVALGRGTVQSNADLSLKSKYGGVISSAKAILASLRTHSAAAAIRDGGSESGSNVGLFIGHNLVRAGGTIAMLDPITTATDGEWVKADTAGDSILGVALQAASDGTSFEAFIFGHKVGTVGADLSALGIQSSAVSLTAANWNDAVLKLHTATGSAVTYTIPSAKVAAGRVFIVKDGGGGAGSNNITVATEGSETIDGSSTLVISTNYAAARLFSDGTNWFTF